MVAKRGHGTRAAGLSSTGSTRGYAGAILLETAAGGAAVTDRRREHAAFSTTGRTIGRLASSAPCERQDRDNGPFEGTMAGSAPAFIASGFSLPGAASRGTTAAYAGDGPSEDQSTAAAARTLTAQALGITDGTRTSTMPLELRHSTITPID